MSLFMWFFAGQDIIWFFLMLFGAFREKKKKRKPQYIYPRSQSQNEIGLKNIFFFCLRVSWFSFFTVCETAR